ncbi:MAG: hypothetical protein WD934_04445 [Gemmatimonadales bacterium]
MRGQLLRCALLIVVAVGTAACSRRTDGARLAETCTPATGRLVGEADPGRVVGTWRVHLVATRGAWAGSTADGMLTFRAGQRVTGSTTLNLSSVGGMWDGALDTDDPASPGALALPGEGMIIVRFGSGANGTGPTPIEAPYTALHVRSVEERRLAGTWESGAEMTRAGGYFCAVRS